MSKETLRESAESNEDSHFNISKDQEEYKELDNDLSNASNAMQVQQLICFENRFSQGKISLLLFSELINPQFSFSQESK